MTTLSAPDWLTLLAERAPELRTAGVMAFAIDGVSVQLAPRDPPVVVEDRTRLTSEPDESDPLYDPASYAGGIVPGYKIDYDALRAAEQLAEDSE